jgi:hypothetical protein
MPRSHKDKTREFQEKMRTQGAAGFAAGTWGEIEESLGMDQSVVVDQEGNPVWSVKHTRKPRQTVSRSTFDRLLGGVAVLAIATLVTSVLAIYLDQTGDPASVRLAGTDTGDDDAAASAIALPQPPTSGFIERPAIEVVASPAGPLIRTPARPEPESQTASVAASEMPPLTAAEPAARMAATEATGTQAASAEPDNAAIAVAPEPALSDIPEETTDPVEAIVAITREEPPAAITEIQPARGTDPAPDAPPTGAVNQSTAADVTTAAAGIAANPVDEAPAPDMLAQAPITDITTEPADGTTASDESASTSTAGSDADKMNASSTGPGTLAQDTSTTMQSAASMPVANEPAGASTTADGAENISAASTEPAGSIAEQTQPAAEVVELARLEPANIAAPEPAGSEPLADVVRPGSTGRWVINLASYAGPRTADRMQRKFEGLGVSTEKQVAEVNGKTMYRLRIASFQSRADAEAYFETIKGALGLESAWITRK